MILSIHIQNIILVRQLHWKLGQGLCVLTGETGAGKSILLDALGFALGKRATAQLVRNGESRGQVSIEVDITNNTAAQTVLEEAGVDTETGCIIRRTITADGKSKAYINDTPVTVQLLKNLGQTLLELHGQNDQSGLLDSATHIDALDAYGRLFEERQAVEQAYSVYHKLCKELTSLKKEQEEAARQEDYLSYIVKELDTLAPQDGEEEELAGKRKQLMQKEKALSVLGEIQAFFEGQNSIGQRIASAQGLLIRQNSEDGAFDPIIASLERSSLEIENAHGLLEDHIASAGDLSEQSLSDIEERLFALRAASRKHRVSVAELPDILADASRKLSQLQDKEQMLAELESNIQKAKEEYIKKAEHLSNKRAEAAKHLQQAVQKELPPLKMENAKFVVNQTSLKEQENKWHTTGIDNITFHVSTNPGSPLAPIYKIASGGELSRFMLALKVVLSDINSVPTLIFDEVDTGIGGAVADAVGKRLAVLGHKNQVLVITHQPQVASQGQHHYKVLKQQSNNTTESTVTTLSQEERQEEIARMLSGAAITKEARAAATKLLLNEVG